MAVPRSLTQVASPRPTGPRGSPARLQGALCEVLALGSWESLTALVVLGWRGATTQKGPQHIEFSQCFWDSATGHVMQFHSIALSITTIVSAVLCRPASERSGLQEGSWLQEGSAPFPRNRLLGPADRGGHDHQALLNEGAKLLERGPVTKWGRPTPPKLS